MVVVSLDLLLEDDFRAQALPWKLAAMAAAAAAGILQGAEVDGPWALAAFAAAFAFAIIAKRRARAMDRTAAPRAEEAAR